MHIQFCIQKILYLKNLLKRLRNILYLQRLVQTLKKGMDPAFGPSKNYKSNPGEKQGMLADVIELENEKESSKGGMNKSSSAVPFINAEETSNSADLYPDLSKDLSSTRVV